VLPVTEVACALQLAVGVHATPQAGYTPLYPVAHAAQSCADSYRSSHCAHVLPRHWLRQVQLHAPAMPLTAVVWPEQSCSVVQRRGHSGYVLRYPVAHAPQSVVKPTGHVAQLLPVHELRHEQTQPVLTFPDTSSAWLLQSVAAVHVR
jgi:hypothetical protein